MHDAGRVSLLERDGGLRQVQIHLVGGKRPALLDHVRELLALEQLEHDERGAAVGVDAGIERLGDVLALDPGSHRGLALKAPADVLSGDDLREHHLEGAGPPRDAIEHLVHGAHPSGADLTDHLVAPVKEGPLVEKLLCRVHHAFRVAGTAMGKRRGCRSC